MTVYRVRFGWAIAYLHPRKKQYRTLVLPTYQEATQIAEVLAHPTLSAIRAIEKKYSGPKRRKEVKGK